MQTQAVADAIAQWCAEECPELQGSYSYPPTMKDQPLPDVVVDVENVAVLVDDRAFPWRDLQQVWIRRFDIACSFMVDNTDPTEAVSTLRALADKLSAAILKDGTLGGRVPFCSPLLTFDFTPPFVEYEDGTRGREMTMQMIVGEPVEESL